MNRNFLLLAIALLITACSTSETRKSDRVIANANDIFFHQEIVEEFERDFRKNFRSALNTNKKNSLSKGDKTFGVQLLKHGLGKSFYYMYQFDKELDEAIARCEKLGDDHCSSPIGNDHYEKLQVYRSINEKLKEKLVYYYMRLLDTALIEDSSFKTVFKETKFHLDETPSSDSEDARDARMILLQLSQKVQDGLESDYTRNPIEYYTSTVLSEVRAAAETLYYPMSGRKNFKAKQVTTLSKHHKELMSESFNDAIKSFSLKNRSSDSPLFHELHDQLKKNRSRDPQGAWINHTGRSFSSGDWALTYDDGPHATFTNRILNVLNDKGWHATFFWLAKLARLNENQKVIAKAKSMGMGLASHSYSHANLGKKSANLQKEIVEAKKILERVYGMKLNFFRLPYGSGTGSSRVKNVITSQNLEHFFWNVDSLDWQDPSPQSIYNRVIKQMRVQKKGIILFHDIRQRTVEVTKLLAKNLSRDISNARIIKLEDGAGVGVANGQARPEPQDNRSFPYDRKITASKLNVRTSPISGSVCASLPRGSVIEVTAKDRASGWFVVNTRDIHGSSNCGSKAYISNSASYSTAD